MLKRYLGLLFLFVPISVYGVDNCLRFKYDVDVQVENPDNNDVKIEKSVVNLSGELGYTSAKKSYSYNMLFIPVRVEDGYCVSLRSINLKIHQNFDIVLDKRLKDDSCAYNLVLNHEKDHMNVYTKVLDDNIDKIKDALKKSVKNLYPVFVDDVEKIENIKYDFIQKIEENKFVKKIKEQINDETTKENDKIDTLGDDFELWRCKNYMREMEDFYK